MIQILAIFVGRSYPSPITDNYLRALKVLISVFLGRLNYFSFHLGIYSVDIYGLFTSPSDVFDVLKDPLLSLTNPE